jgi:hypothetical protein
MKRKESEKRWWEKFEAVGKHDIYFPLLGTFLHLFQVGCEVDKLQTMICILHSLWAKGTIA